MFRLLKIAAVILFTCVSIHAQVVPGQANIKPDKYGGVLGYPCVGGSGATGFFYLYKDTALNHWLWCSPEGYRYYLLAAQVVDYENANYTTIANAKYGSYGSATSWQAIQSRRLRDAGFNMIGFDMNGHMPSAPVDNNINRLPFEGQANPGTYATHPSVGNTRLHDLYANLPPRWDVVDGYRGFGSVDLYDPKWAALMASSFNLFISPSTVLDNNPYLTQFVEDDIGFVSVLRSMQATWIVGATAPWVQYENSPQFSRRQVFSDPVMYSKKQWSTWLCGTRYANLAALNAAWGSTYSTCSSSATTAASETIGTGNGVLTSFSYTFLHGPVDPASIGISVGGVLQGGDCPWFNSICIGSSGTGISQAQTGNINGGAISYNSGGAACGGQAAPCITVTFSAAPANGVAITATYQYAGWPKATAGGAGLLDEDGTSAWWPQADPVDNFIGYPQPAVTAITQDMDVFLNLLALQYYAPIRTYMSANYPHHPLGSVNPVAFNARNSVLSAMAANTDFIFMSPDFTDAAIRAGAVAIYNFTGEPIKGAFYGSANPDSPFGASGCIGYGCPGTQNISQSDKGSMYATVVNAGFNLTGADGYKFMVGCETWSWTDNLSELTNWGFVTENDNLYDGVEAAAPMSVIDPYGFRTTPETPISQTGYLLGTGDGVTTAFSNNIKLLPIKPSTLTVSYVSAGVNQLATDAFGRVDANPLSGSWTTTPGDSALQLVSNNVESTSSVLESGAFYNGVTWSNYNDQYSLPTIGGMGASGNIDARVRWQAASASGYACEVSHPLGASTPIHIERTDNNVHNILASSTISAAAGQPVECDVSGTFLTMKVNNVTRLTATDTNYAAGNAGIGIYDNSGVLTSTYITAFSAGNFPTNSCTDDGNGNITGASCASGTIKYLNPGSIAVTFSSAPGNSQPVTAAFTQSGFGGYQPSFVPAVRTENAVVQLALASGTYSILSTNLALEKPAMFTSATETLAATQFQHANDGDITTSWQPTATNPQAYRVDLVGKPSVSKITLRWGAVYATAYTLDWSDDGLSWTTAFTQAAGAGGVETDTFTAVSHRYWRGNFTARSGAGSLILQEMEVLAQ